ncbi:MAG: hypothetical protein EPN69_09735 [Rhodanobacter sp.]|nr:MAG: hypothetical protein EPN69_09735 [Rhodanobacter sp.]TAM02012.1 MAG: hypothetical protein EPN71_05145 [Rhodanobacter sp.]TAM41010.1 MAG: hypothetical protein EPN58_09030 [Rhodanobacter sp.]
MILLVLLVWGVIAGVCLVKDRLAHWLAGRKQIAAHSAQMADKVFLGLKERAEALLPPGLGSKIEGWMPGAPHDFTKTRSLLMGGGFMDLPNMSRHNFLHICETAVAYRRGGHGCGTCLPQQQRYRCSPCGGDVVPREGLLTGPGCMTDTVARPSQSNGLEQAERKVKLSNRTVVL